MVYNIPDFDSKEWKIIKRFIRKGRNFVQITDDHRTISIPQANFIWLLGNPGFPGIPNGYVIHHLDCNEMNDDISNLVLMFKHHHTAYHLKNITAPSIPIEIDPSNPTDPLRKPTVGAMRKRGRYYIRYTARESDKIVHKRISNRGEYGDNFKSKEEAEKFIERLWPDKPWRSA